jgi:hypothetical protein
MPVVFRWKGYKFFFFSNEGNPLEPAHIHVRCGDARAKFWLAPEIALAESYALSAQELNKLVMVVAENRNHFVESWHEYFG